MRVLPAFFSSRTVLFLIVVVVLCGVALSAPAVAQNAQAAISVVVRQLITQPVDEAQVTVLKGNTHPLARAEFDLGTAPASLPMERMLLVLKRSPEQELALRKLLDDQQDKASRNYHKWLTPDQYGKQFGPTDSDIQTITAWLQSHGFQVGTTKGRSVLEFSGSASQVQEAFHTTIHKYIVNGEQRWANASDPSIPTALTGAVAGVLTLHNFVSKPQIHFVQEPAPARLVQGEKPEVTFTQNGQEINALEPQDYAVIYNINPAYNTYTGVGETIGVIGRSNTYNNGQDVQDFHNAIGNGNGTFGPTNFNVVLDGPDPGNSGGGEEAEAILDSTWSSSLAPGATVDLVVSGSTNTTDGIDLSEQYIVENNFADIMTESFSGCEYFATDARLAGINALAEQAAAQGITYFVSSGDSGAEGCDNPNTPPASGPVSVNALASTAFNVAVGGTIFNENGNVSKYWGTTPPISKTALSYIPEDVWNESSLTNGLWAGSGGASAGNLGDTLISPPGTTGGVPKPSWQSGQGLNIPADGVRDVPDVSLTAAGHDPYLLCFEGSCVPNNGQIFVYFISGTSASAPSFAGIMALVDQSQGGRQGQANYVLYPLAASQASQGIYPSQCNGSNTSGPPAPSCIFNDITVGNNVVPGEVGTNYQAGSGYDLTTGLGSVNVSNLINNWSSVKFSPTTTALTLNGGTTAVTINHGQSVTVGAVVAPNSGTATPTGDVVLLTGNGIAPSTLDLYHLSSGQASGSTSTLPGSGNIPYNVWVHYSGDGTFAPSNSNNISVTVNPEPSTTTLSLSATDLSGNPLTSPYPFGALVFVRADVVGNSGKGIPTGPVNFSDTFGPIPAINPQVSPPVTVLSNPPLNSQGNTSIGDGIISFDAGNHSISASYVGDPSFAASSSTAPVTFAVSPGFAAVSGPTTVVISSPGLSGTSTVGIVTSTGFTTAVTFACTSGLPTEATCSPSSVTGQGPTTIVNGSILVSTRGPHSAMVKSNRQPYYFAAMLGGGLPLVGFLLGSAPRRRRWSAVAMMMLLLSVVLVPACGGGGGGGSHQTDPGTPAGTYTVNVTATSGSLSAQGAFTLVVQ